MRPLGANEAPASALSSTSTELNRRGVAEAQAGRFEGGVAWLRRALALNPQDPLARKNLSGVLTDWARHLERHGRAEEAIAALQEATVHDPQNGMAFTLLGDLLYLRRSDMAAAIRSWRQAHGKVPDAAWPAVAHRISQAQRDQAVERGFIARQTAHCDIRFQDASHADVERLARVLEEAYARLSQELGAGPSRVTAIVYTDADLRRTYNQRDWAIGFYDGRIRLRVDDMAQSHLEDLVAHELAHAFLHHVYGNAVPIWVHEGYAQRQEHGSSRTGEAVRIEQGVVSRSFWIPLKWLDRHFEQPSSTDDIARAYVQARVAVGELIQRHGAARFKRFLAQLAEGAPMDVAYDQTFAPSRWARADVGIFD